MAVSTDANYIYVNAGTYTLDTLTTAVGSAAIMSKSAGPPYTYTIFAARQLQIYGGAIVNIDTDSDTLKWDWTGVTAVKTLLSVGTGASNSGTLTATTNVTIDANGGTTYNSTAYVYGSTSFQGTAGNEIDIIGFYNFRFSDRVLGGPSNWDYVNIKDPDYVAANSYSFYFTMDRECTHPHTFDHVTISNAYDHSNYAMLMSANGDFSNCTFNYFNITNLLYGPYIEGCIIKFTNSTWKNINGQTQIKGTGSRGFLYSSTNASDTRGQKVFNQPKITFESCTFQDNYDSNANEMAYGFYDVDAFVKFKNCTFAGVDDASAYGVAAYYSSRYLYEGTTTFTNVTNNRYWVSYGSHYDVFALTMTVSDIDGNPIQDAMVDVYQSEDYERWRFLTNSSGQVKDVFSDDPVFVYREILSNTPTYDYWSDSIAAGRYHKIVVYKDGYQPWETNVVFDSSKIINVHLFPTQSVRSLRQV